MSTLTFDGTAAASNKAARRGKAESQRVAALALLSIRFIQGFIYWRGVSRRFKLELASIAPIRSGYAHSSTRTSIFHAGAGAYGQPISTTHPDPARIVNRKSCNFTMAATRFRPRPKPDVPRTFSDL